MTGTECDPDDEDQSTQTLYCTTSSDVAGLGSTIQPSENPVNSRHEVWYSMNMLIALFTSIKFMKGGHENGKGPLRGFASCGELCFWLSDVCIMLVILLFAFYVRSRLLSQLAAGATVASDVEWNETNTLWYPLLAVVAGLVAGLSGIGKYHKIVLLNSARSYSGLLVLYRRWDCQGPTYAGTWSASVSRFCDISLYDSLYERYGDSQLCCFWFACL